MRCSRRAGCTGASTTCSSAPDMLSGFTLVRNAVSLDYPIVPAIRSILAVCDEVVVNVGRSEDGTRDLVAAIGDPRVRILDREWDFSRGSEALARETDRAMAACGGGGGGQCGGGARAGGGGAVARRGARGRGGGRGRRSGRGEAGRGRGGRPAAQSGAGGRRSRAPMRGPGRRAAPRKIARAR